MASFALKDGRPYRLRLAAAGPHCFGGKPFHQGVIPPGTDTPLHLLLTLDLSDEHCPIKGDGSVRCLPLYYPLKYGWGGAEVQYDVVSDSEIKLLHMSNEKPDSIADQYVQVAELPSSPAELVPLTYEEARIVAFKGGGYFQPNEADRALLEELNRPHWMIRIGGSKRLPVNAGDMQGLRIKIYHSTSKFGPNRAS
jgi:hypothetical protein